MTEEMVSHLLGNIGVPAAICLYTLIRVNQTLKDLTLAINNLATDSDRRLDKIEANVHELKFKVDSLKNKERLV